MSSFRRMNISFSAKKSGLDVAASSGLPLERLQQIGSARKVPFVRFLSLLQVEQTTASGRDGTPGAGPSDGGTANGDGGMANGRAAAGNGAQPALSVTSRDWEARKLHDDLHRLADDPDLDQ